MTASYKLAETRPFVPFSAVRDGERLFFVLFSATFAE